ncbi:MAG: hypothetical protein IPM08_15195 [Actinomycetales bacterium]|nr:hypothetical protein [Actinomycetales bacterium]
MTTSVNGLRAGVAVLVAAVLAAYLGSDRPRGAGRHRDGAPSGRADGILGNVTNLRWILVASATFLLLARFDNRGPAAFGSGVLILAALSDPLALALVPLALLRLVTWRGMARLGPSVFLVAAIVQQR